MFYLSAHPAASHQHSGQGHVYSLRSRSAPPPDESLPTAGLRNMRHTYWDGMRLALKRV